MKPSFMLYAFVSVLLSFPLSVQAKERIGVSVGAGLLSDKGLFGVGIDVPVPTSGYVGASFGVDLAGTMTTLMYKHPVFAQTSGTEWYTKCLFVFECKTQLLLGAGAKYFHSYSAKIRPDAVDEAEYELGSKFAVAGTVTLRESFRSGVFWDIDLSYRQVLNDATTDFVSGTERAGDRDELHSLDSGFGIGTSLGYRF